MAMASNSVVMMPALDISLAWRAAALPIGIALMAVFAVLRLLRHAEPRHAILALLIIVAIVAAFWLAAPLFKGLGRCR